MRGLIVLAAVFVAFPACAQNFDPMQYADSNSDGKVTAEEFQAFSENGWNFIGQGADKVKPADVNPRMQASFRGITPDAEGFVSKAAYLAAVPARFKAADKNGDGTLDRAELTASFQPAQ